MATASPAANAACPGTYGGLTCDNGGADICQMPTSTTMVCDLTRNGYTAPGLGLGYIVHGIAGADYHAWGTDESGADFCCPFTDADIETIVLNGTPQDDTLHFYDGTNSLDNHGGVSLVTGRINGGAGDDDINGSNVSSVAGTYTEVLHGDADNDSINGYHGDDEINGDGGDDILYGGLGADTIYGNGGSDEIKGMSGHDTIWGGAQDDYTAGNDGDDLIYGDGGDDHLCGDDGDDEIHGGLGADLLFGAGNSDTMNCGNHTGDDSDNDAGDTLVLGCGSKTLTDRDNDTSCPSDP